MGGVGFTVEWGVVVDILVGVRLVLRVLGVFHGLGLYCLWRVKGWLMVDG